MFLKHLKSHGHGHGHGHGPGRHNKIHKHSGRHEKFGPNFKYPSHHRGKDMMFKGKYHRGMDCDRDCFTESELPDDITQNVNAGCPDTPKLREFYRKRHHWKHGSCCCCCEKNVDPAEIAEKEDTGEKNDAATTNVTENINAGEISDASATSIKINNNKDKTKSFCHKGFHHFEEHHGGHHKGKRGHGFYKPCRLYHSGETATQNEDTTDNEDVVKQRKHHRGHHGGRRGHKFRRENPDDLQELAENYDALRMFNERHHHRGKWGHKLHGYHHNGWRRHGRCIVMVDAAVNTGDADQEENVIQEVSSQEVLNTNQIMEQDDNEDEVSQEQADSCNDEEVLEVVDHLKKSSIE